jgi:nucleotide-binding universal stress UspA family protein
MRPALRRILCATDLSDSCPDLFSFAASKADEKGASILVLHVVGWWAICKGRISALWAGVPFKKKWARVKRAACDKMTARMARFFAEHRRDAPDLPDYFETRLVVRGKVAEEIAAQADQFQCDAIVIGGPAARTFRGHPFPFSNASRLARLTRKPIHVQPRTTRRSGS